MLEKLGRRFLMPKPRQAHQLHPEHRLNHCRLVSVLNGGNHLLSPIALLHVQCAMPCKESASLIYESQMTR